MFKRYILAGSFLFLSLITKAQKTDHDSTVNTNTINFEQLKTSIDVVYNHYEQDGNHSAVTGGIGTEHMSVYGPSLSLTHHLYSKKKNKSFGAIYLDGGSDVITSASVDNIDFVTSISLVDLRNHVDIAYTHDFQEKGTVTMGGGHSFESDYWSFNVVLGYSKTSKDGLQDFSATVKYYDDDLRWGRLYPDYKRPVTLIYPYELRYPPTEWHDVYKRNSLNLKTDYSFFINAKNSIGLMLDASYQHGLLSTSFHRVYKFGNDVPVVENLPEQRLKIAMGIRWNTYVSGRWILKNNLSLYQDSWDITGITFDHEAVFKVSRALALIPTFRLYAQSGTPYFHPYQETKEATYFTSDYDYSKFSSYNVGLGLRYLPLQPFLRNSTLEQVTLRYSYYNRGDGLQAHMVSAGVNIKVKKKSKLKKRFN